MTRKKVRRVEAWAVLDTDGSFIAGPSNSRSAVEKEAALRWGEHKFKATKFVPHDPDAERVLRLLERLVARSHGVTWADLTAAVAKRAEKKR